MELTEDLIKRRSKQFDVGCITLLDLSGARLRRLTNLDGCVNVIKLDLANNEVSDLDGLPVLTSLLSLDLSHNRLASIDDLPRFPALEELILSNNAIALVDFKALVSRVPRLRKLHLDQNPVEANATFLESIRTAFPNLLTLNGEAIAFYEALSQEPASAQRVTLVQQARSVEASPATSFSASFKVPPFDAEKFVNDATARLEEMLRDAKVTLETESRRVEQAFRLLEA